MSDRWNWSRSLTIPAGASEMLDLIDELGLSCDG
jgi:hypothetical protein